MTGDGKAEFQSYYGKPVIKGPAWKPYIPLYFFAGGMAGVSASLSFGASLIGHERLARNAGFVSLASITVSTVVLIADLGRPSRFYNMLRMFKITSPMSVGSWLLGASGGALGVAVACDVLGVFPRVKAAARAAAGILGLPLTTYTAALVADTAVPVWHEARRELPFVYAASSAASAGAAAYLITPSAEAEPARRLALAGAALETVASKAMGRRLGELLGEPYRTGRASRLAKWGTICTRTGGTVLGIAGRRRAGAVAGCVLLMTGSLLERWAVFQAGKQSANDPKYTVIPQRQRVSGTES